MSMRRLVLIVPIVTIILQIIASIGHASTKYTFELKLNKTRCGSGKFLNGKGECERYATCTTIKRVIKERRLSTKLGNTKKFYIGRYAGIKVVYSVPSKKDYINDFKQGVKMVRQLQGSDQVIRLVGYCDDVKNLQVSVDFVWADAE